MKLIKFIPFLALMLFASCSSVSVVTDYDRSVNFTEFKTYAYLKSGLDDMEISDLDKKRIMQAIDFEMASKGFMKGENPDLLLNLFTDTQQDVYVKDRKSTRLNSSHVRISYAVFCLKKKK